MPTFNIRKKAVCDRILSNRVEWNTITSNRVEWKMKAYCTPSDLGHTK